MRMGLGVLKLAPSAFWEMSPIEFQRAMEGHRMSIDPKYDPDAASVPLITEDERRYMDQLSDRLKAKRGGSSSIRPLEQQGKKNMQIVRIPAPRGK